jgi:hypothetical protein
MSCARFPKTHCGDQRRYNRQIRNRIGMNSMMHTETRRSISSSPKHCRNWAPRIRLVTRHRCHFVKQRLRLATQTTIDYCPIEKNGERSSPQSLSACGRAAPVGATDGASDLDKGFPATTGVSRLKFVAIGSKLVYLPIVLGGTAASHTYSGMGGGHFLIKKSDH